jgi:hypothetical protein
MLGRLRRSEGRQFAAAILIFALMFQGIALAVATGRPVANAAGDANWAGFEICRRSSPSNPGGDAAAPHGAPEQRSDAHCIFCLAGATHVFGAPAPSAEFHGVIALTIMPWTFTAWRLPAHTVDASARPRGPPPA